jgi:hypothetical protein
VQKETKNKIQQDGTRLKPEVLVLIPACCLGSLKFIAITKHVITTIGLFKSDGRQVLIPFNLVINFCSV